MHAKYCILTDNWLYMQCTLYSKLTYDRMFIDNYYITNKIETVEQDFDNPNLRSYAE